MSVFGTYSRYYNLLYKDKDYPAEAEYIRNLIQRHCPDARTILDLGCGTGRHDLLLAEMGYDVTGVDRSEEMLAVANSQARALLAPPGNLAFHQGDIRSIRLAGTFDVVVSLFHVMSYQLTNDDLQAAFATAMHHLRPGGLFIFDCWYGPAVLTDRPAVRVKRLEDEAIIVTRLAEPVMHPNDNLVDIQYQLFIRNKASGEVEEVRETHTLRYLFAPEVGLFCNVCGLQVEEIREFMGEQNPGFHTWNAVFICTKAGLTGNQ